MIDKFKDAFREEAYELLSQLEDILLELEASPKDLELINAAFRAIHTIKGSAGMFGFEKPGRFAHDLENLLDACRAGKREVDKTVIDLTLRARDKIRAMIEQDESEGSFDEEAQLLIHEFRAACTGYCEDKAQPQATAPSAAAQRDGQASPSAAPAGAGGIRSYRIRLVPARDIFLSGTRPLKLLEELAALSVMSAVANFSAVPSLDTLDPEACYTSWDAILSTDKGIDAIRDVFIFVEDQCELSIDELGEADDEEGHTKKLGEILLERGAIQKPALDDALKSQRKLGEVLIDTHAVSSSELQAALAEQDHLKRVQEKHVDTGSSVRVASEKLDQLVDLVGEMVTLQARLSRTSGELADTGLSSIAEQLERLVSQLRDNAMSIRMLPIGSTFSKFRRVVRDLSRDLGKQVDLLTEGEDTELDKTVIERLNDPLVHIIRNSLDHGIEQPHERKAKGKPEGGTICLSASHSGATVEIRVSDDGNGLNLEAIRNKARERGIMGPNEELSEQDTMQLIFRPSFSTAQNVSAVSGRGVGMDVVKREIDALGGGVYLESKPGQGTTVVLSIPLTLAIIEGLLVRIGGERFVIPLSCVEACVELEEQEGLSEDGSALIHYRGDLIPIVDLRRSFAVPGEQPALRQVVVANDQGTRTGYVVDAVIGDYQTVIKPLGRLFKEAEGISGATILGDGTVALIIDHKRVSEAARRQKGRVH
ncbi:MAG TPA: chemotaxis protein CheA [Spirochaetaceae bacterium]|jgi:two-component system chemotaxis sensor kinase CheA|nr:chemotaxis protein CheA [Spirochaetaceae bacterium]